MAGKTHEMLLRLRKQRDEEPTFAESDWKRLTTSVRRFAEADTKEEKRHWFTEECGLRQTGFLAGINVEDGDGFLRLFQREGAVGASPLRFASLQIPGEIREDGGAVGLRVASTDMPGGLWEFSRSFLETWLVQQRIDLLMERVDAEAVAGLLQGERKVDLEELVRKALALWLVADHGLVEKLGHGLPDEEGFAALPRTGLEEGPSDDSGGEPRAGSLSKLRRVKYRSLAQALKADDEGVAIDVYRVEDRELAPPETFALVFQISHVPYDRVILLVGRRETWKVRGLLWLVS